MNAATDTAPAARNILARRPVCPKCGTRVCMTEICNPPAPVTVEEHAAEVARSAACIADLEERIRLATIEARHAEHRLAGAFDRNDAHGINNFGIDAEIRWSGVARLRGYWQSAIAADLRTRIAARAAGVQVRV